MPSEHRDFRYVRRSLVDKSKKSDEIGKWGERGEGIMFHRRPWKSLESPRKYPSPMVRNGFGHLALTGQELNQTPP